MEAIQGGLEAQPPLLRLPCLPFFQFIISESYRVCDRVLLNQPLPCCFSDFHFKRIFIYPLTSNFINISSPVLKMPGQIQQHKSGQAVTSSSYDTIHINAKDVSPQKLLAILERRLPRNKFSVVMQQDIYTIRWDRDYFGRGI
jgi:hypothetical protein